MKENRNNKGQFVKSFGLQDLTGMKFNRLTVIKMVPKTTRKTYWECLCECGNITKARGDLLKSGNTKSCGCLKKEVDSEKANSILKKINTKHGISNTDIYQKWHGMMKRCTDPKDTHYKHYGARGIKVCHDWSVDCKKFESFCLQNGYKKGLEIDRIDVNGNYEPSNCRFVTRKNNCNNRRSNINITYNNETKTLSQWCGELKLNYGTIHYRYHKGMRPPELFNKTTPR